MPTEVSRRTTAVRWYVGAALPCRAAGRPGDR